VALHLFHLRRIESRIHHAVYRADKPLHALLPKLDPFFEALTAWRSSPVTLSATELDYAILHYHRAVRLLIQPFLPLLLPSDKYHTLCLRSAGEICQAHKRLHQSLEYGHSFIAVQTVFVAGMTLLYSLSRWTKEVWNAKLADDIRACSLVLFVMGERTEWVRRYRDAFEVLVNVAMAKVHDNSSGTTFNSEYETFFGGQSRQEESRRDHCLTTDQDSHAQTWTTGARQDTSRLPNSMHFDDGVMRPAVPDSFLATGGGPAKETNKAWPIVVELANWIDQDEGSPVWMPDFEMLQNLAGIDTSGLGNNKF
jgi:hypothetical protein